MLTASNNTNCKNTPLITFQSQHTLRFTITIEAQLKSMTKSHQRDWPRSVFVIVYGYANIVSEGVSWGSNNFLAICPFKCCKGKPPGCMVKQWPVHDTFIESIHKGTAYTKGMPLCMLSDCSLLPQEGGTFTQQGDHNTWKVKRGKCVCVRVAPKKHIWPNLEIVWLQFSSCHFFQH